MKRFFTTALAWVLFVGACLAMAAIPESATAASPDLGVLSGFAFGGLLVNKSVVADIFTNLKATFNKQFEAAPSDWEKTATLVPSSTKQNDYAWLSRFPRMREWVGSKVVKALAAFAYTIINKDWEATIEVMRNDIEDDTLGIYGPMAMEAGFSAKQLPDEIVSDLKNNAFTNVCFDGQYFYDTDHPVGETSVSNKLTTVLSNATLALALASYGAARTAMMNFKDEDGRPLNLIPDTLEVPPALEAMGTLLLTADKLGDDSPNPYKGTAKLLVNPRLTSSTAWFLHCTTRPLKPFLFQERKKPVFVQQTDSQSDDVFNRGAFKFGAEARSNGGYGLWHTSVGSTGAGA